MDSKKKRLLLIAVPSALVLLFLVLLAAGVFKPRDAGIQKYTRPFLLHSQEWNEPATLSELLNRDTASIDVLLASEKLTRQLLEAKTLTDVADSRLSMNNLRRLRDDATALEDALAAEPGMSAGKRADGPGTADSGYGPVAAASGTGALADVAKQLDELLAPSASVLGAAQPQIEIKGTWAKPDDVLLHWTPHDTWIPDDGYRLFRIVGGQSTLIAEKLGTLADITARMAKSAEYADMIGETWGAAALTAEKMAKIGVTDPAGFAGLVYSGGVANVERARIAGDKDFTWVGERLLTVPGSAVEKLPEIDASVRLTVQVGAVGQPVVWSFSDIRLTNLSALALKPMQTVRGYDRLAGLADGEARLAQIGEIMQARNAILAKSFTDRAFARDVGLAYQDDLSGLGLAAGTVVTYRVETSDGISGSLAVTAGQETLTAKPAGLAGFGVDDSASLRWQAPADANDREIVSGYHIERRSGDEKEFTRITEVPVAISYTLDETGVYFESPVFYEDTGVKNGQTATYRIQALDLFGRASPWSDEFTLTVYKVTPPDAPGMDQPVLSTQTDSRTDVFFKQVATLNKNVDGIILPITRSSSDSYEIVVYRSKALGANQFDDPAEIGRVALAAADADDRDRAVKVDGVRMLLRPTAETRTDLAFYDDDVKPGYTYKYWAAAVDDWGNESVWSVARILGVPLDAAPSAPSELQVALIRNDLPDPSIRPAGFGTAIVDLHTVQPADSGIGAAVTPRAGVSDIVLQAEKSNVAFGVSLSSLSSVDLSRVPGLISTAFGNLPDPDEIHAVVALGNDGLRPDGAAMVSWTPYSGSGLAGYHIYRAYVDDRTVDALQALSREELVSAYPWTLVQSMATTNKLVDPAPEKKDGRTYLYLVCLVPESRFGVDDVSETADGLSIFSPGGWVQLDWQPSSDPQTGHYRIYRCEVARFDAGQDPSKLEWVMVRNNTSYTHYTEKVDQTYAHYYYYKVTAVSIWGVESAESAIMNFRVPATSPPQTPAMLLPLSQKNRIQVNWAGVEHASRYLVYRTTVPRISEEDIIGLQTDFATVYESLFQAPAPADTFLDSRFRIAVRALQPSATTPILSVDKFNTLQLTAPSALRSSVAKVDAADKLAVFRTIADKYGPLALSPYSGLSEAAANLVLWEIVGEVPVADGTDPTGAYEFVDETVVFGSTYEYTVQAVNDDELASARPMPVESTPRKAKPFDPVTGLSGTVSEGKPLLSWNQAKEANLTWAESRRYVAGYLVYRSTEENGLYCQASPLLEEMSWRDESADRFAFNWYRVKVVDTAGYLSDFSEPVLVRESPAFVIRDVLPILSRSGLIQTFPVITLRPVATPTPVPAATFESLAMGSYRLTDVRLTGQSGTATMSFGNDEFFEVRLSGVVLGMSPGFIPLPNGTITAGTATIAKAVSLPRSGVTFSALTLTPAAGCVVDGYLERPSAAGVQVTPNLMGDLYALRFTGSAITQDGVFQVAEVPGFRYGLLEFAPSKNAVVTLNQNARLTSLVQLSDGTATVSLGLETLDNAGLQYRYSRVSFDPQGRMSGILSLDRTQTLRLVIPAGLGLRATSSTMTWKDGAVDAAASSIQGRLILPFRTFDDLYVPPAAPARISAGLDAEALAGFDRFLPGGIVRMTEANTPAAILASLSDVELQELDASMVTLATRIQSSSLLVLPSDPQLLEQMSTVPFDITGWSGQGFTVLDAAMSPANVGNSAEDTSDAIGVTPGRVVVDLDRQSSVAVQAPAETQEPFWMGIVVKQGRVALPAAYVKNENDTRISFELESGELLYDLNGVSYQNLIYNAQGTPANFGSELGGFRDVKIFDCMIDLYGNTVNIEMNGELGIPLFGYQKVKVRLYTNQDATNGQKVGKLIATISETDPFDPSGTGEVKLRIRSGQLMPDGLHMNGTLDVQLEENLVFTGLAFTELIVPSDMERLTEAGNADRHYGTALFDTPLQVRFYDFNMQLRALSFGSTASEIKVGMLQPLYSEGLSRSLRFAGSPMSTTGTVRFYESALTLWGGLQLSDNLAMNVGEDFDRIVIGNAMSAPAIRYEESKARMAFEFEEFIRVNGVVKPKPKVWESNERIIEYETDGFNMLFNTICDLAGYPVQANVRFGYDEFNARNFFVLGSYYDDPEGGISFYYGKLNQIVGILAYNVNLPRGTDGRYAIPKGSGALFDAIDAMQVNPESDGNFFFASTCNIYFAIGYSDISIPICDVRDVYIVVETGPAFDSAGDFYAPLDVAALAQGKGFVNAGRTRISYYHPEGRFQFSTILYEIPMYTFTVSGEAGFEMNSVFWEVRIGYPNALKASEYNLFEAGFGIAFRDSEIEDDSWVKAQMYFAFDSEAVISPVYVRAYLNAGAEGFYAFDEDLFRLTVWLNGGVEGGIKVAGKRYAIISFWLDATGTIVGASGQDWRLDSAVGIHYSIDLWIDEIEGSVTWNIQKTF